MVRKWIAKGESLVLRLEVSCHSHLLGRNTSSSFTLAFWNKSKLVLADLIELIFMPEKTAPNFDLETQTSLRLLALVKVVQKGGWLFYKDDCVQLRSCSPNIKMMWETTYLGNLCEFMKSFEQSWPTLGGLDKENQWAFLILTECLLVYLSLLRNPVKYFIIRKDFLSFNTCWQREATFSDPVLGNDLLQD